MGSAKFGSKCKSPLHRFIGAGATRWSASLLLVQERIFKEFYSYTFPSEYMSFQAFAEAMDNKLSATEKTKLQAYFRAFDAQQKSYLTYSDYLLGKSIERISQRSLFVLFHRLSRDGSKHFSWRYRLTLTSFVAISDF